MLQVLQPEDGGVAEHVLLLATGLAERGWDVEVASSPTNVVGPALARAGIRSHALTLRRDPSPLDARAARELRLLQRSGGYRLVHAHSSKAGALARAVLPRRATIVYTPHGLAFVGRGQPARRLVYRAAEQALVPRSAAIIAVSEWERKNSLAKLVGASARTTLIRNGVRPCPSQAPDRELVAFKDGAPLAGMVSVLRPEKDPLAPVRAVATLAARGFRGRLAIIGNGGLAPEVRFEIERLGVEGLVRWFPYEPPMGRYLAAIDLLLVPSLWEAMPLGPMEALASGVPVLASAVGGIPEVVEDGVTGRLVPPGDSEALATALERLLPDTGTLRAMGAEGRRVAGERFAAERMVRETEDLYLRLL